MTASSSAGPSITPDKVLADIAEYVLHYKIDSEQALDTARLCLLDTVGCGLDALDFKECTRLLGPIVPGTTVPLGARIPGTGYELDPMTATFNFGCMIRWLDYNDTFSVMTGGHPSDNLAAVLMVGDYRSRKAAANGDPPLVMRDLLENLTKAYEIQGCLSLENDLFTVGIDHNLMVRIASAAVSARMLGANYDQVISAVSNAWIDCSLQLYRLGSNTGSRKNWACADVSAQAVRLAMMAIKGEQGYPAVVTAKTEGFQDARLRGKALAFQRPYGDYVIQNSTFKLVPAGMHSQTAMECATRLHPSVSNRLDDIERIDIQVHRDTMRIMYNAGLLLNPSARDHCAQYVVALGLMHGKIAPQDFSDAFAADPRIDGLRAKTVMKENAAFTKDFDDPAKRSSRCSVQVWFKDGSSTPRAEVEYPLGHYRRRADALPALRTKFADSLRRRYPDDQQQQILALCSDNKQFDHTPVHEFVELLRA